MKDKFPYFPHSSTTTEKKWDKELFDNKFIYQYIHPIAVEIEYHYPYYGLLDRKEKRIAFFNRHREPIPKSHRSSELQYWCKIDINNIEHYTNKIEYKEFQEINCEVIQFYEQSDAVNNEKGFTEYIKRLNHIDRLLLEVSPMQQRFALTIKKAYELKKENDFLNIENERLIRINKELREDIRRRIRNANNTSGT